MVRLYHHQSPPHHLQDRTFDYWQHFPFEHLFQAVLQVVVVCSFLFLVFFGQLVLLLQLVDFLLALLSHFLWLVCFQLHPLPDHQSCWEVHCPGGPDGPGGLHQHSRDKHLRHHSVLGEQLNFTELELVTVLYPVLYLITR